MALQHAQDPPQASRKLAPTPIQLEKMMPFLRNYHNKTDARRLINGFTNGFSLGYEGERVPMSARNLKSAFDHPQVVESKIGKEVELGRIVGPFSSPPFQNFRCSPIGVVPKHTPGEFRLIHHLSSPRGSSVNDQIDRDRNVLLPIVALTMRLPLCFPLGVMPSWERQILSRLLDYCPWTRTILTF